MCVVYEMDNNYQYVQAKSLTPGAVCIICFKRSNTKFHGIFPS